MSGREDWLTKLWYFHTMEYYAAIKEPGNNHITAVSWHCDFETALW